MKLMRDTIEQLAWYIVALVLVAALAVGSILYMTNKSSAAQILIIKEQTEENKRFLKCLILLPQDPTLYKTKEQRVAAVDNCAKNNPTAK